ncbi:MAG: AI-2E family transporter, partial [Lentisphaerae bacterium]|nr:AI-2E family transporter [Lentisphaerota bacterium]
GVPAAFFLAVISSFCAIIPFVGTSLVWGPVAVYLLCVGRINAAVFICAWGLLVVANIDGLVRPWLMSGGKANLSFGVLFFAILGGLQTYGLLGIVYGPILAGIFITCLSIFAQKYKRS